MEQEREKYEKPEIADYGDLKELTSHLTTGSSLDATFPEGTPFADLTFSP